ncbi:LysR family transcriptional regulator [Cobetia marina]|jgi:DNA-binding transcriptional LysR family regulator|uniref:LysR family transcriptional regulator n=2 Tax=Cobetia TaxID=204286 RepID=A0AAP4TY93_9GAMM|nr:MULTISPECIES: LysR family transcriptional regulator [Cobetia]AVV33726.1 LysR family transcriptional regulator [Halomonas sp. SF2003]MBR9754742.1 LysR family transcriptional regulator [Gammaproteobacteria bacterium]TCJ24917.1 LysR family transcriptional regulator [Halomonas sp. GDM18]AOM02282.1 LysR family transcriptional regulator [Cobetia marina]AZV32122.1 LysR family transcriptional regulator [Cobetia sp. ICG0124]|tara:strand:+ start:1314 stop:2213 length:900 start_codon:yes stop_codon:yes gene_type:complete
MATLDALRVFVEVVRAASFTAAARRLGISKSLASKRVAALEEQLGVSLINRSTRKLHLTEAGRIYYEHGLRIREELESAEARVQSVTSQPMGQLKVSAQVSFGFMYLAAPTTAFMRRYPDVSVEILLEDQRFEPIDESVDLAIRMGPLPDSSMVSRPLCKVVYGLYAAPDYLARVNAPPVQPQDIRAFDTIFYGNYDLGAHWRFTLNGQPFDVEPESRLVINNLLGVVEAAKAGFGLAYLPTFSARAAVESGELVPLLQPYWNEHGSMVVLFRSRKYLPDKTRAYLDFITEWFQEHLQL